MAAHSIIITNDQLLKLIKIINPLAKAAGSTPAELTYSSGGFLRKDAGKIGHTRNPNPNIVHTFLTVVR
jgi:hypothetical protein